MKTELQNIKSISGKAALVFTHIAALMTGAYAYHPEHAHALIAYLCASLLFGSIWGIAVYVSRYGKEEGRG